MWMDAPLEGDAEVVGAWVIVLAIQGNAPAAPPRLAGVAKSTIIAIITRGSVGHKLAAHAGLAGIVGTGVPIVASQDTGSQALAQHADITGGAYVTITAGGGVQGVVTPGRGLTGIVGAGVGVVASDRLPRETGPVQTQIPLSTRVLVIARAHCWGVATALN